MYTFNPLLEGADFSKLPNELKQIAKSHPFLTAAGTIALPAHYLSKNMTVNAYTSMICKALISCIEKDDFNSIDQIISNKDLNYNIPKTVEKFKEILSKYSNRTITKEETIQRITKIEKRNTLLAKAKLATKVAGTAGTIYAWRKFKNLK